MKTIRPIKRLFGEITPPGDKSISHRAVMLSAIARGETHINGLLDCDDCDYTIRAFKDMGIAIEREGGITIIKAKGLRGLSKPRVPIFLGNSGTSMRLLAGILAGQDFEATLVGDESLSNRPMARIVEPLSLMGANVNARDGEYPPLTIKSSILKPIDYKMPIPSAQVKSCILFAALYSKGVTRLEERVKSRDHTERMMKHFGARLKAKGLKIVLEGGIELTGKTLDIPGDISSASFFIVGATLIKGSKIKVNKVGMNPTRIGILNLLSKMGAKIRISKGPDAFEPSGDIEVEYSKTHGIVIEERIIPSVIDELPMIFVLASLSSGRTVIKGARELRVKETDRINSMKENLGAMGAKFEIVGDEIIIDGVEELKAVRLKSFNDHRTCMAMAIAALRAKGESEIDDIECVNKSFPGFFEALENLSEGNIKYFV